MSIRTFSATLVTAFGLGLAGAAFAADMPSFEEVDTDKSGTLSKAEAAAVEDLEFASADTNRDGVLSRSEYAAAAS